MRKLDIDELKEVSHLVDRRLNMISIIAALESIQSMEDRDRLLNGFKEAVEDVNKEIDKYR